MNNKYYYQVSSIMYFSNYIRGFQRVSTMPAQPIICVYLLTMLSCDSDRSLQQREIFLLVPTTMADEQMQEPLEMLVTRRPKRSTAGNR